MTVAVQAHDRWERPGLVLAAGVLAVVALVALPVLLREQTRDWTAYEQAAGRLEAGAPLYVWELATEDDEYYLYPPGMAALWAVAGSPELLLLLKIAALVGTATLAPLVVRDRSRLVPPALPSPPAHSSGRRTSTTSCSATSWPSTSGRCRW